MKENINFNTPSLNLEGRYTIQLFDKDGSLLNENKGHNCINKGLFGTMYNNFLLNGIVKNDCMYNTPYGSEVINNNYAVSGLVKWLFLTKSDLSNKEDSQNAVILGDIAGFAHSDDSNIYSDSKRGVINKSESAIVNNYIDGGNRVQSITKHFVWDFGTDKANGTFSDIYLRCNNNYDATSDYSVSELNSLRFHNRVYNSFYLNCKNVAGSNYYKCDTGSASHDKDNVYIQNYLLASDSNKSGTGYNAAYYTPTYCYDTITKIDMKSLKTEYITLQVPSDNASRQAIIVQGGGLLWRIERSYNCTRYTLDGTYKDTINLANLFSSAKVDIPAAVTQIIYKTDSYSYTNSIFSNGVFSFTGDNNNIYISYKNSTGDFYIVTIDKNGNKLSEILSSNSRYKTLCIFYIDNHELLIDVISGESFIIKVDGTLENTNELGNIINIEKCMCAFYSKDGDLFYNFLEDKLYNFNTFKVAKIIPWSSHIKLDTPITKTSANTMKIQYDITCEYVPVGGIENIE